MSRSIFTKAVFTKARLKGAAGIAGLTAAGLVIATLPGIATSAAWLDDEWVSATQGTEPGIGTFDCEANDLFSTRGEGRFLSGELLSIDLDNIAELSGVEVLNDGTTATPDPASAIPLGSDAWANPLDVTALNAINLALTGLLQLPLANNVGVVNQVGQAESDGHSMGAAGAVADSGAIQLTPTPPGPVIPTSAQLSLDSLLTAAVGQGLSDIVSNLAGLDLSVGAVASYADLDACPPVWDGATQETVWENLDRDYLIAGLSTTLESPLLGALVAEITESIALIEGAVNGIAEDDALVDDLLDGLLPLLTPLFGLLGADGPPTLTVGASIDLSAVTTLLNTPIEDANGVVSINLGTTPATISVDLAALFDSVNGLNNQNPNTQLLINDAVINALTTAVATALTGFVTNLETALDTAITSGITLTVDLDVPLAVPLDGGGVLNVSIDGPLNALAATSSFNCTDPGIACGLGATLALAVDLLDATLIPVVTGLINPILGAPLALIVDTLILAIPALTAPIVTLLSETLDVLFGEQGLVSLVVNAQNAPDPADGVSGPLPGWAAGLDAFQASPFESGQYDVSALRLVVLGTADVVEIDLARSSAGNNVLN